MPPIGFEIGPLYIRFYGIILMIGALAATFFVARQARKRGLDPDFVWDALIWALIGGVIGARLWHIFTPTPTDIAYGLTTKYYLTHPLDAINIRMGGLGIPGAVLGGLLAIYIYTRRKNEDFLMWIDLAAPGVALAIPVGLGLNYVFSPNSMIGLDFGLRYTTSDYIDGYTSQFSRRNDVYYFMTFIYTHKLKTTEKGLPTFRK